MKKYFLVLWLSLIISLLWFSIYANSNVASYLPDSFNVEVIPDQILANEPVDLKVTAIKNWDIMKTYEWYFDIIVMNEYWVMMQSSEATVPDGWWGSIRLENVWKKNYPDWLIIKKPGDYKIIVTEFTNESVIWEASLKVIKNGTLTNSDDEIIAVLNEKWITIHVTWDDFKPNKTLRRDEAAKMLSIASSFTPNASKLKKAYASCNFKDINNSRADLIDVVQESCKKWLFKWSNGLFNPQNSITNAQVLTVIGRMIYWIQNESWEHYAEVYINKLLEDWYLSEMNLKREKWDSEAKRWDIAKILFKVIK